MVDHRSLGRAPDPEGPSRLIADLDALPPADAGLLARLIVSLAVVELGRDAEAGCGPIRAGSLVARCVEHLPQPERDVITFAYGLDGPALTSEQLTSVFAAHLWWTWRAKARGLLL